MLTLLDPEAPRIREAFRVLDDLTAAVLEAAAIGPLLLVLEDMHWADRSTQDFAASLSRTARGGLLLVLTFRNDELHHRHPFRKTLAEIGRTFGSRRIDLGPLDRDDIAGIVAARTAGPPDPSLVSSVLARSDGNPLYAEELLAAHQQEIPDHLSDLLLARIDALDEGPRALLRLASVNGTRLDTETLAELAGLDQAQMEGYLREALDANVLRQNGDTLEFRHPLLREATYDDLMPDERTRTHGRLAEILQATVDAEPDPGIATLSRLAFHWNAAHDLPRTLTASVRAGLAAKRLGAAEAVTQLERALALWDRVPDAQALAGRPQAELVVLLAEAAAEQNDGERWRTLLRTSVEMLGPDPDRLLASRVYSALVPSLRHGDAIGKPEAIRLAIEYAGDSPTEELARALNARSLYLNRHAQFAASAEAAQRATDAARIAGCVEAEVDALYLAIPLPLLPRPHRRRTRGSGTGRGPGTGSGQGRAGARRAPRAVHGGRAGRSWPVRRRARASRRGWPWDSRSRRPCAGVRRWLRSCGSAASTRQNGGSRSSIASACPQSSARWHAPRAELLLARGDTARGDPPGTRDPRICAGRRAESVGHRGPDRARARGHARRPERRARDREVVPGPARRL